ncbi:MAG: hypothetical protein LBD41_02305, partial [Clostridiales Family XIII bacterium]|nr:hypothetical protein [Clostridiales Family XIII bacterium]
MKKINMISRNNFLVVAIFCYCAGASVALEADKPKRLIAASQIATVAQNYTQIFETELNQFKELIELENQIETINDVKYVFPQLFFFSTSDEKEYFVKVVLKRSKRELIGAKRLQSFLQDRL